MTELRFRLLTREDEPFLWEMLAVAAHEQTVEAVKSRSYLARYVGGWGREGDGGVIALVSSGNRPVGAAWFRLWAGEEKGFGYIDSKTPELAIGVLPSYHGKGVGTQLLHHLIEKDKKSYASLSLSVRAESPVVRLYRRVGFEKIQGSDHLNRAGTFSFKMVIRLDGK